MKNKDGSVKPGYKMTPLGEIPEDWKVKKLGDLGTFDKGRGISKQELSESGLPCVRYGEIYTTHEYVIKKFVSFINNNAAVQSKRILKGDILLASSGETLADIGKAVAFVDDFEAYAGGDIIIFTPQRKLLNSITTAYLLESHFVKKQKARLGVGAQIVHIYPSSIKTISIPVMPLNEQKDIAKVLSTWEEAIEKTRQLIEQKKLRKKALMQQLLNGKKRLKGFSTEWKLTNYGDILRVVTRNIIWDDDASYQLISIRRRSEGVFKRETLMGNQIAVKNLRKVRDGDFVISKMQIVHGASALITKEFDGMLVSGSYITLGPQNHKHLDIRFINWYSKTLKFYHQTFISSYGVHIEKMTFNLEFFLSLEIQLPPIEEQKSIVKILQSAEDEIEIEKHKLEQLKLQKKALMQVLLTGKKRIGTKPNE